MTIKRFVETAIMHRIVEHNGVVYMGGVVADEPAGVSMRGQASQIFDKLDKFLFIAGSDKTKILAASIFITDLSQKKDMNEAWNKWLDAQFLPARATIGVADLGPDVLIEVLVTASK